MPRFIPCRAAEAATEARFACLSSSRLFQTRQHSGKNQAIFITKDLTGAQLSQFSMLYYMFFHMRFIIRPILLQASCESIQACEAWMEPVSAQSGAGVRAFPSEVAGTSPAMTNASSAGSIRATPEIAQKGRRPGTDQPSTLDIASLACGRCCSNSARYLGLNQRATPPTTDGRSATRRDQSAAWGCRSNKTSNPRCRRRAR
jgi:hypothetical protein